MNPRHLARILLAAFALTAASPSPAEPAPRRRATPVKRSAPAPMPPAERRTRIFDFEADTIDGGRISPDGTTIFGLATTHHASLIRLRGDFVREILRSADAL